MTAGPTRRQALDSTRAHARTLALEEQGGQREQEKPREWRRERRDTGDRGEQHTGQAKARYLETRLLAEMGQ
eukprot:8941373-Alexandrium_andersonii.AAC.1